MNINPFIYVYKYCLPSKVAIFNLNFYSQKCTNST